MPYNYYDVAQVLGNVIKVVWTQDNIQDMTYRAYPEIDWLKSIHEYKTGKQYSFGITYTPAYGSKFGYTDADGFSLPTPITEGVYQGYVNPRTLVTRRYLTQEAILDTGNDVGALIQLAKDAPQKTAEEHGFHLARNAWTGAAGLMGAIASISSTTVTLVAGTNMRKFGVNNYIDIKNMTTGASGSTNCDSIYITAVDEDALTITVSAAPTTGGTTTDFGVYLQDETYASDSIIYRASWNSIPELIGTGTVCNIDPSTYVAYKSYVNTATGTLTSKKIQKLINWIRARYKKIGMKLELWCSPEVLDEYGELLVPDVRFS